MSGAAVSYRVRGIVLQRTKLGETDLIVTLLTDGTSQARAVAKGGRKPGARLAGIMGLGNEVDLLLRRGRSLDVVTEGSLVTSRAAASADLEHSAAMSLVLEVAAELTAEGEYDGRMLPLASTALDALLGCRSGLLPLLASAYVLKAVSMQGYRPVLRSCVDCGDEVGLDPGSRAATGMGGRVCLSLRDGGVLCDACAMASGRPRGCDVGTLAWAEALIGMRFSQLVGMPEQEGEAALGLRVLGFCRDWLGYFPGIHPKALDFVLSLGTF